MNFARLNHVLVPSTKSGRDKLRRSIAGKAMMFIARVFFSFSREGRVLIFFWLLSGLLGLEVRTRQSYLVWCLLTGLIVICLVSRLFFKLRDVRFSITVPDKVSVGEVVRFNAVFENEGSVEHQMIRVFGPFLPWDGKYVTDTKTIQSLPPGKRAETTIEARFIARGEHHLDVFSASALVPFGITAGPSIHSSDVRVLIVPRIAPLNQLRMPLVHKYQPGGVALASQTGESMELMGIRPYRPGDPIRDLHSKRWARLGTPVVREYQQEYFTRVGVVVDTDIKIADEERFESALSLASGVLAHLSRGEALIDLLVVGHKIHQLTLGRSLGFLDQALELLAIVEPGPQFDAEKLSLRLSPHLEQLSCIVFVSLAWDGPRQAFIDRVLKGGVGCRVLHVTKEEDRDPGLVAGADLTLISAQSIDNDKELIF